MIYIKQQIFDNRSYQVYQRIPIHPKRVIEFIALILIYKSIQIQISMEPIKTTIELTKSQKLKKINEKLSNMLKSKNISHEKAMQKIEKKEPQVLKQSIIDSLKPNLDSQIQKQSEEEGEEGVGEGENNKNLKTKKIKKDDKKNPLSMRKAAGLVWQDKTMQEWPENDYRIFCGNLGNQCTDQILGSVFRRYASFQKARVVRDKRTGKTRGYGFVSFTKPNDFLNALKEINGRHVGNRPVKLMKSNWQDRNLNSAKNQMLPSDFKTNAQKETNKICLDFKYISPL